MDTQKLRKKIWELKENLNWADLARAFDLGKPSIASFAKELGHTDLLIEALEKALPQAEKRIKRIKRIKRWKKGKDKK